MFFKRFGIGLYRVGVQEFRKMLSPWSTILAFLPMSGRVKVRNSLEFLLNFNKSSSFKRQWPVVTAEQKTGVYVLLNN